MNMYFWQLSIIDKATSSLISQVVSIALALAAILFVCNLSYNYLKNGYASFVGAEKGQFPDYMEIGRCIVIIILISLYLPVSKVIVGSAEIINAATQLQGTSELSKNLSDLTSLGQNNYDLQEQAKQSANNSDNTQEDTDIFEAVMQAGGDILNTISQTLAQPAVIILHVIIEILTLIVGAVIKGFIVIISKILVVLGPLAFAFSILPCFRKQIEIWFGTLLNALITLTTLNILDCLLDSSLAAWATQVKQYGYPLANETLAMDLVILFCYVTAFWLTSKVVGKGDAGKVLSKMVGTATALAGLAMTGGASAGASNLSNVAKAGQDIINNNTKE